jgi:hypothetical protein
MQPYFDQTRKTTSKNGRRPQEKEEEKILKTTKNKDDLKGIKNNDNLN